MSLDGLLLFAGGNGMSDIPAREKKMAKMFYLSRSTRPSMNTPLLANPVHPFVYLKSTCTPTVAARKVLSLLTC